MPTAAGGEEGSAAAAISSAAASGSQQAEVEAYRPSTFSFLRNTATLRASEEAERREGEGEQPGLDPAAAEAARRAFEGAVLAQWQRLRAQRAV